MRSLADTVLRMTIPLASIAFFAPLATAAPEPESKNDPAAEAASSPETVPENPLDAFDWVTDGKGAIGDRAQLAVPEGYRLGDRGTATTLLQMMGNIPNPETLAIVGPEDLDWFAIYEFEEVGYVEDDDRDGLDADELLAQLRESSRGANEIRRERGLATVNIDGWALPPTYNEETKLLEWATLATFTEPNGETSQSVNFRTKVLGRKGFMDVVVVCGPDELDLVLPQYRSLMGGFAFVGGERYDEYEPGDKVAEYGLAALVVGGATAVAAKAGLFAILAGLLKKGGKLIVLGIAAVGAFIARLFGGKKR